MPPEIIVENAARIDTSFLHHALIFMFTAALVTLSCLLSFSLYVVAAQVRVRTAAGKQKKQSLI